MKKARNISLIIFIVSLGSSASLLGNAESELVKWIFSLSVFACVISFLSALAFTLIPLFGGLAKKSIDKASDASSAARERAQELRGDAGEVMNNIQSNPKLYASLAAKNAGKAIWLASKWTVILTFKLYYYVFLLPIITAFKILASILGFIVSNSSSDDELAETSVSSKKTSSSPKTSEPAFVQSFYNNQWNNVSSLPYPTSDSQIAAAVRNAPGGKKRVIHEGRIIWTD